MVRSVIACAASLMSAWGAYTPSKNVVVASDRDFEAKVVGSDAASFVWFLAPWWGHCSKLKPDYAKLADAFKDNDGIQIVEVDCTAGGEQTCQRYGVRGYPTLQYFTATTKGGAYNAARDFTAMKNFVSEKLQVCNAKTLKGCAPNQLDFIKKNKDLSTEELQAMKKEKEGALKDMKKERSAAQAELREKEKTWSRTERNLNKAIGLIKQLEKNSKDGQNSGKSKKEDVDEL